MRKVNANLKEKMNNRIFFLSSIRDRQGFEAHCSKLIWDEHMILSIGALYSANSLLRFGAYIVFYLYMS